MALRVVFMGTPHLACASLKRLLASSDCDIVAVVTQPDRPKGRDLKLQESPVKLVALEAGRPVLQPLRARDPEFLTQLQSFEPELIVVAAYGQILPRPVLELPRFGCINVHTSLLPRYRGAAPIQWAILNGDTQTGVTIMKMDCGLDTGEIISQASTLIGPDETADGLHDRLADIGANLLVKTIPEYIRGTITLRPQPTHGVVYAPKIKKQDGHVDWSHSARAIHNRLRGLTPWPGIFTFIHTDGSPRMLKIWKADVVSQSGQPGSVLQANKTGIIVGCGTDSLRILELQIEGGRRLTVSDFLLGHRLETGQLLR